jgi:hypothetical protein
MEDGEMALTATQIWVVEYTGMCNCARTSFFFEEAHAQQWFDFCRADGRAAPSLWTSQVDFAAVQTNASE